MPEHLGLMSLHPCHGGAHADAATGGMDASSSGRDIPALRNERYKLCRILCKRGNGWTLRTFCRANYTAVCTEQWRAGHATYRCVSPIGEFTEKVMETQTCVDSQIRTKGGTKANEADSPTMAFCLKYCDDPLDRDKEWNYKEVWGQCQSYMTK